MLTSEYVTEISPAPEERHPPWSRSKVLNVWVDNLSMRELMTHLQEGIVFTLNPDHLYHLQRHPEFFEAFQQSDFITSDSKFVYWATHFLGRPIQEKVSGSDVVPTFCHYHRDNPDVRVYLLGAKPGVADLAMKRINEREGRDVVVGAMGPSMNFVNDLDEIEAAIERINSSNASVLIVGLGAPKQEIWITKYRHRMPNVKIFMGVGATIDYQADVVRRAPGWMTRNGLEWVFRMVTEPRRYWRRYLRDIDVFWLIFLERLGYYRLPEFDPLREDRTVLSK
jgi:exopolysaccharide biosynthesis WecB/TagA/CpsF family protein